jgi:ubiquinone/menaquinone biosynthesis C-methylase UbiE
MTDFNKVEAYYSAFNEWDRLDAPSGRLEFELTMDAIKSVLSDGNKVLDLGGGPGRYTLELAKFGYEMHLADISDVLLDQARARVAEFGLSNVKSINKVNAMDLSIYESESFDVVLLMGPLYHLTDQEERIACISEVYRVLKPEGIVLASYIPRLSGAIGIIDRAFNAPKQVDVKNLSKVFEEGIFNNNATRGFQEGYYPTTMELNRLFESIGFKQNRIRSVRGFGFNREEQILGLKDENRDLYDLMIRLINETAEDPGIIDTCAHALYVGSKA